MKKVIVSCSVLVLAIIAFGFFVPSGPGCGSSDPIKVTKIFVDQAMETALMRFKHDVGRYPTTAEGLLVLQIDSLDREERTWRGPYIEPETELLDPWGNHYQYRSPGIKNPEKYDLWSFGPDMIHSDDDIGNWEEDRE